MLLPCEQRFCDVCICILIICILIHNKTGSIKTNIYAKKLSMSFSTFYVTLNLERNHEANFSFPNEPLECLGLLMPDTDII